MALGIFRSSVIILVASILPLSGCNAINPACGSARPSPILTSIDPTSVSYSDVQKTFTLNIAAAVSLVVLLVTTVANCTLSITATDDGCAYIDAHQSCLVAN